MPSSVEEPEELRRFARDGHPPQSAASRPGCDRAYDPCPVRSDANRTPLRSETSKMPEVLFTNGRKEGMRADRNFKFPSSPRLPPTFVARKQPSVASKLRGRVPCLGYSGRRCASAQGPPDIDCPPTLSVPRRPQASRSAVLWSLGQADPVRRPLPLTESLLILEFTARWAAAAARAS